MPMFRLARRALPVIGSDVRKWNQLIVRTEKGRELVELAVKRGVLEVREAPAENLKELKDAAVK